jgi:hypothetical protein
MASGRPDLKPVPFTVNDSAPFLTGFGVTEHDSEPVAEPRPPLPLPPAASTVTISAVTIKTAKTRPVVLTFVPLSI